MLDHVAEAVLQALVVSTSSAGHQEYAMHY